MTSINLRPDDLNIQSLKRDNEAPAATRPVSPGAPAPRVHGSGEQVAPGQPAPAPRVERRGDRRGGVDRRQRQIPVILDTRSKRERRRSGDADSDQPRGVDEIV